jgi:hypothetical protein
VRSNVTRKKSVKISMTECMVQRVRVRVIVYLAPSVTTRGHHVNRIVVVAVVESGV